LYWCRNTGNVAIEQQIIINDTHVTIILQKIIIRIAITIIDMLYFSKVMTIIEKKKINVTITQGNYRTLIENNNISAFQQLFVLFNNNIYILI